MSAHEPVADRAGPDPVMLAATTWLACGVVLLGLTPLPLHDATLGWSPAFWLLAAPTLMLLARRVHGARGPGACRVLPHPRSRRAPPARRRRPRGMHGTATARGSVPATRPIKRDFAPGQAATG